ncbi:MAG: DUF4167 domain-containing protein [Hyphomicrobiaceae bacterium]
MRQGQQHRRGRGRNNNQNNNNNNNHNRKGQNPLTRSFESNGPDVKVRGTPAHVAEKYLQLARDAQSSGDHVLAENYLQHAEHYNRIILAFREQQIQQSGEVANGQGRPYGQHRHESHGDGDEPSGNVSSGQPMDDFASLDQPQISRAPQEQPVIDDQRPQRSGEQQHRYRDRQPRHERQEGYDRPERNFDRQRERPHYAQRDIDQPVPEARAPRDIDAEAGAIEVAPPVAEEAPQRPARQPRGEGGPRRRERYGSMGAADQPDFLRRPVRRPRRDADTGGAADAPVVQGDDTPAE